MASRGPDGRGYGLFYRQMQENFSATGAIAPSSRWLAEAITVPLEAAAGAGAGRLRVLEVGAGTGVFTEAILRRLGAGDALTVYEINPAFAPFLERAKRAAGTEARGIGCEIRIENICDLEARAEYDVVISGLPLNNFAPALVSELLGRLMGHVRAGGVLSYFEYLYIREAKRRLIRDAGERARLEAVGEVVKNFLAAHECRSVPVWRNLPPAMARHVRRAG